MAMEIGDRPAELDGCWSTWTEKDIDNVIRTEFDSGAMQTRRRYTGVNRVVSATVRLKAELYPYFMDWYRVAQRNGSIATKVITPYGDEEVFQWTGPPTITWPEAKVFTAQVTMWQGAWF